MEYLSIRNWEKYQHYKDRAPQWIKLYSSLLDAYDVGCLPDASKWHLIGIMLLASRYDNQIPADVDFIKSRLQASEEIDLELLLSTKIIVKNQGGKQTASEAQAKRLAREEKRREEKRREEKMRGVFFAGEDEIYRGVK